MSIYLTQQELEDMPVKLKFAFEHWLKFRQSQRSSKPNSKTVGSPSEQLTLDFNKAACKSRQKKRIKLPELLDAGLIFPKMPVRVRLMREIADKLGRTHINGMVVSSNGCVVYNEIEYDCPSPLAMAVNQDRRANGWEYVEVKTRQGSWVRLEELRALLNTDSTNKKYE